MTLHMALATVALHEYAAAQPDFSMACAPGGQCEVRPICRPVLGEWMPRTGFWGEQKGEEPQFSPMRPPPDKDGKAGQPDEEEAHSDIVRQARRVAACKASSDNVALMDFAVMVQFGMGGPRSPEAARSLYRKVNTRRSLWYLGLMIDEGEGGTADPEEARALYKRSSEGGQIDARYEYARMLRAGVGGPADPAEARRLLADVVTHCHGDGAAELAEMAENGEGGPVDIHLAAKEYLHSIICNNPYFRTPTLLSDPEKVSLPVRLEIQRMQAEKGPYDGPRDGSVKGWKKSLLDDSLPYD